MPRNHDLSELAGEASVEALARLAPFNVWCDAFDRDAFGSVLEASDHLRVLREEGREAWPSIDPLLQDVFSAYYRMEPELLDEAGRNNDGRANRPFITRLLEDPATAEARTSTALDDLAAALATLGTARQLLEEIRRRPSLQQLAQAAQNLRRMGGPKGQAEALAELQAAAEQAAFDLRRAAKAAARAGQDAAHDVQAQIAAWGLDPAELRAMPLGDRLQLIERLRTPRLRRLATLIGRMRNLARARQRERLRRPPTEMHSITIDGHLERALPAELVQLRHPLRRLDLLRRLQERRVLEYDLRAREAPAKGPMLVCIDTSSSMAGEPQDWAVAVALALADQARRERRTFGACAFNARVVKTWAWPRGTAPAKELLELATLGSSGGTLFGPPISWALDELQQATFRRADLVLISDGESDLDSETTERLAGERRRGLRAWGILIGGTSREMVRWCDRVWQVRTVGDDVAGELFDEIAKEAS